MFMIFTSEFGMLQVRENEISLRKWSAGGTAHLRASDGTLAKKCPLLQRFKAFTF